MAKRVTELPDPNCPILIGWQQIGAYLGCSAETARARAARGDFPVHRPRRWNMPIAVKTEINEALLEIAKKAGCGQHPTTACEDGKAVGKSQL
jgi:hypothetical protein